MMMTMNPQPVRWSPDNPLQRGKGETRKAAQALRDYAMLGAARSLVKLRRRYLDGDVLEPPTRSLTTLQHWSAQHEWQRRVAIWEDLEAERRVERWRERRDELAELDWQHGKRLRELASKIMDAAPAFVRRREKRETLPDGTQRLTVTVALDTVALTRIEKLASDLQRLAAELPTARVNVSRDWRGGLIAALKNGDVTPADVQASFPPDIADELISIAEASGDDD